MSRVTLASANLRDLSYIAANMREADRHEIGCQLPEHVTAAQIAAVAMTQAVWCAYLDGQPVAAVGYGPISYSTISLWAWGTNRMRKAVPAITRFVRDDLAPSWVEAGVTRVEARSIVGHHHAHRWLRAQGFEAVDCPCFGKNGEDFLLFAVTRVSWQRRNADALARATVEGIDA